MAQRAGNWERASELKYSIIPSVESKIPREGEGQLSTLLAEVRLVIGGEIYLGVCILTEEIGSNRKRCSQCDIQNYWNSNSKFVGWRKGKIVKYGRETEKKSRWTRRSCPCGCFCSKIGTCWFPFS